MHRQYISQNLYIYIDILYLTSNGFLNKNNNKAEAKRIELNEQII
jgi:hypothetical protein